MQDEDAHSGGGDGQAVISFVSPTAPRAGPFMVSLPERRTCSGGNGGKKDEGGWREGLYDLGRER